MESLSPVGTAPRLSTYWIDEALTALVERAPSESVIATGNSWSLVRDGESVNVRFDYASEGEEPIETIAVNELAAGLTAYRQVVLEAIESGHKLDQRLWAQRNPR